MRPQGFEHGEITLGRSAAPERGCDPPPEDPFCRWGDYAGATPDPRRRNLVWGSNQLNGPELEDPDLGEESPHWGTRNFALVRRHGEGRP